MKGEIKIGILIPQSRQYKTIDRDFLRGIKLQHPDAKFFIESIGIGADEQVIIEKIQKLNFQEDINIIIGLFGHYNMDRVYEYASGNNILLIASDMGAVVPSQKKHKGVYINSFGLTESSYLLGDYFTRNNYNKIAIATSYYDSGYGMLSAMEMALKNDTAFSGHYITPFQPRPEEPQFMESTLQASEPDAVFAFYSGLYANENAAFIAQNNITQKYPFYMTAFSLTEKVLEDYKEAPHEMYVVSPWMQDNDAEQFNNEYVNTYAEYPGAFSLLGYENGLIVAGILDKAGNSTIADMLKAADALSIAGPRGIIQFDPENNRTSFDHYIYSLGLDDQNNISFTKKDTLNNNGDFIRLTATTTSSDQTGGWHNAYLCH